jgi:hypothetical protein
LGGVSRDAPRQPGSTRAIQRMNHERTAALSRFTIFAPDGSTRSVYGYRALAYNAPRGSVFGYMPELNVLCAIADHSAQSGQPLTNTDRRGQTCGSSNLISNQLRRADTRDYRPGRMPPPPMASPYPP